MMELYLRARNVRQIRKFAGHCQNLPDNVQMTGNFPHPCTTEKKFKMQKLQDFFFFGGGGVGGASFGPFTTISM